MNRRRKVALVPVFLLVSVLVQATGVTPTSAFPEGDFSGAIVGGAAWGADGELIHPSLPGVTIGKVAPESLPCGPGPDDEIDEVKSVDSFNTVVSVITLPGLPPPPNELLSTGVVVNRGHASFGPGMADATQTSTIANVSALNGLISATTVVAKAHTTLDDTGFNHHTTVDQYAGGDDGTTGVEFVDLRIAGVSIGATVAPNTVISLGAIGHVVLNEQILFGKRFPFPDPNVKVWSGIKVNAIHVYVDNFLGYSGDFLIAHAETSLALSHGQLSGHAYLSQIKLAGLGVVKALSGPQNPASLGCTGTGGVDKTSVAVGIDVPSPLGGGSLLNTGTSTSTVNGDLDPSGASSHSTETIQSVSLLNGLISADVVTSDALTMTTTSGVASTGAGSSFANLVIGGTTVAAVVAPNTKVVLPGIGFVRLNGQSCISDNPDDPNTPSKENHGCVGDHYNALTVVAIEVVVDISPNPFGLPLGARVLVGVAHSDVKF